MGEFFASQKDGDDQDPQGWYHPRRGIVPQLSYRISRHTHVPVTATLTQKRSCQRTCYKAIVGNLGPFKSGMLFSSALLAILAAVPIMGTHARGQIPAVGGVHGAVPSAASSPAAFERLKSPTSAAVTSGGLRVVENSGVCGAFSLSGSYPVTHSSYLRDN